jgi:hypothetical protein
MDRKQIAKIGSIVMILSLLLTIFVGAMSVKAATPATDDTPPPMSSSTPITPAPSPSTVLLGPNSDLDADGIINNEDPDIDGDGIVNGLDPDIDGDGIANGQDGNPASTNLVDSSAPGQFVVDRAWQWTGGIAVLAVLGWLVALPYLRKRRGTSSRSVGSRGKSRD